MSDSKAIYGSVCHPGGEWTVYFERENFEEGNYRTSYRSGYGEFPSGEYPDLPVVRYDLSCIDAVIEKLRANIACACVFGNTESYTLLSLEDYLQWHVDHGIVVENLNGKECSQL